VTRRERRAVAAVLTVVLALALGLTTYRTAHAPTRPALEVTR
jgi:hypothetical protein